MKRTCAYTGKESLCTDKTLPTIESGEESHNWTSNLPCNLEYKESKAGGSPTDIEAEIHETFYLLELARWKTKFLENKLARLQAANISREPQIKTGVGKKNKEKKKEKEIEVAIAINEITKDNETKIEEFLTQKKRSIF